MEASEKPPEYQYWAQRRQQQRSKSKKIRYIFIALAIVAAWFSLPYFSAYRLANAVREGDSATLEKLVDWPAIRSQTREILMASAMKEMMKPGQSQQDRGFAGLGMALASAMIGPLIDSMITPTGVAAMVRGNAPPTTGQLNRQSVPIASSVSQAARSDIIRWAAPTSPTSFDVWVGQPGTISEKQIRATLEFRDWGWKLTRINIPDALM